MNKKDSYEERNSVNNERWKQTETFDSRNITLTRQPSLPAAALSLSNSVSHSKILVLNTFRPFLIDSILGQQELPFSPLELNPKFSRTLTGVAITLDQRRPHHSNNVFINSKTSANELMNSKQWELWTPFSDFCHFSSYENDG